MFYLLKVSDLKRMYVVNYIVNLVNVSVIKVFYEIVFDGKIGLSFVYILYYLIDIDFKNV